MQTRILGLFAVWLLASEPAGALSIGQTDNFEDGTTQGWTTGSVSPNPPSVIVSGGPAGADDNYLRLTSNGGSGPGSRLVGINASQWTGDYSAAGIAYISMYVANFGPSDLSLRLYFSTWVGGPVVNEAISTDALSLNAGAGWTWLLFPILGDDLTALNGSSSTDILANVTQIRLFHGADPKFPGDPISAALGIDNICALGADRSANVCDIGGGSAVSEPGTLALLGLGLAGLALSRRRAKARPARP